MRGDPTIPVSPTMFYVGDGIYRGPRPHTLRDIPGVKTVLSLESGWFEVFHDDMYAEDIMAEDGEVRIYHVPINSLGLPPSRDSLEAAYKFLSDPNLYPMYVHCKEGVDRTGMVVAYYRCKNGWRTKDALSEMYHYGFHRFRYFLWILYFKWLTR